MKLFAVPAVGVPSFAPCRNFADLQQIDKFLADPPTPPHRSFRPFPDSFEEFMTFGPQAALASEPRNSWNLRFSPHPQPNTFFHRPVAASYRRSELPALEGALRPPSMKRCAFTSPGALRRRCNLTNAPSSSIPLTWRR